MKTIKLILVLAVMSSVFLGCVQAPVGTPTPMPSPTAAPIPTAVPTTVMPSPSPTMISSPIKYIVWIDSDYGFYTIRAVRGNHSLFLPPYFDILNFTIHTGDKVRWMNDDSYDFPLTIVSNEGLWTGRTGLMRYQGEHFEYIFNKTGTYDFSIQEYPRIEHQKITVAP
jgi:hypothetical protein